MNLDQCEPALPSRAGAGCFAIALLPSGSIPVPTRLKIVFTHRRLQVSEGGLFGGGDYLLVQRSPSPNILGYAHAVVTVGGPSLTT